MQLRQTTWLRLGVVFLLIGSVTHDTYAHLTHGVATSQARPAAFRLNLTSLFYIHSPKTGTSLLTAIRNFIPSCPVKDFTCLSEQGGGFPARMAADGNAHYPVENNTNFRGLPLESIESIVNCSGAMVNCQENFYHCPYWRCMNKTNKVTMFRDPHKWFSSYLDWQWLYTVTQNSSLVGELPFLKQIQFTTGTQNVSRALETLESDYVFWGITDYWPTTICLFHCELGGDFRPSELQNTRPGGGRGGALMKTGNEVEFQNVSRLDELVPNRTAYILEHYSEDLELYYKNLMPLFRKRATRCNCK